MKRTLVAAAVLSGPILAVFAARLPRAFVHWDDDVLIVDNARLSLAPTDVAWMFTTGYEHTYQPLGWLIYGALNSVFGRNNALAYHTAGLLLHAANGAVLVLLLSELACPLPAAALGAAAWTLHPLMVDTWGWSAALPDVLATTFYLLALLAYIRWTRAPKRGAAPWACLALFAASGLSRWKGVNLPIVLVLLDLGPLERGWRLKEKLPLLAACAAIVLVHARLKAGMPSIDLLGSLRHPLWALWALSFYLTKALIPAGLASFYLLNAPGQPVAAGALATLAVAGGFTVFARRRPEWLGAWLCYATALLPTCGASAGGRLVAMDHYAYLALLPWTYPLALWLSRLKTRAAVPGACAALALLLVLSWRQLGVWQNTMTLWTHALEVDPESCPALSNLGQTLYDAGERETAALLFKRELELCPDTEVSRHHRELLGRPR